MNLAGTILAYLGLIVLFLGLVWIVKPLKVLGVASRLHGLLPLIFGVVLFLIGESLPAPQKKIEARRTELDEFVPEYQFSEFHSIRIQAPRERVYRAMKEVRADEILFFVR